MCAVGPTHMAGLRLSDYTSTHIIGLSYDIVAIIHHPCQIVAMVLAPSAPAVALPDNMWVWKHPEDVDCM